MTEMTASVHVLAKTPMAGRVKTRLQPVLGAPGCAALARAQLAKVLSVAVASRVGPVTLWVGDGPWHPRIRELALEQRVALRAQRGDSLGERMATVVADSIRGGEHPILVGTDCPTLTPADLQTAAAMLRAGMDGVIGPARDGGYYLLGLGAPVPALFRGMAWGGAEVLSQTLRVFRRCGKRVALLADRDDVDRPGDLAGRSPFAVGLGQRFRQGGNDDFCTPA